MEEIIYRYDGTLGGFLTCVFESYASKESPATFQRETDLEESLFPARWIDTSPARARRVLTGLGKIDPYARELVLKGFLTCTVSSGPPTPRESPSSTASATARCCL